MDKANCLTWIELSKKALAKNVASLAKLAGKRHLAVSIKSNAYGHGLREIVTLLDGLDAVDYLTVESIEEAAVCREEGWRRKLMLLGPVPQSRVEEILDYNVEPVICDIATLKSLSKLTAVRKIPLRTHLKLETGTHRQGIADKELPAFAKIYRASKWLKKPYGASTHFANIEDTTNHEYAAHQLAEFNRLVAKMKTLGIAPVVRHTASSAATILFDKTRFELVRPGISAYGHWPSKETYLSYCLEGKHNNLFVPVLSWKTRVTQIKDVPAHAFIGYGCTYRTTAKTKLAILPIGYYEGYSRALSNRGHVLIHGKRAPVRGRVCMNLMMVDVSDIKGVKLGDEVTLIGSDGRENVTAEMLGDWSGTINYEILARLSPMIPRIVVP
ncbi:MAG: alanine racemase [Candidatus Zixiibacteriota bacterium]